MSLPTTSFQTACQDLQRRLRYNFRDIRLLESSLFHHSIGLADSDRTIPHDSHTFELTEKLGDGVLKVVIQNLLQELYSKLSAGELTRRESLITCNDNLAHLALRLQIPRIFSSTGCQEYRKKPLADTVEALFYAIALDAGSGDYLTGLPELRRVCKHLFKVDLAISQIFNPYDTLTRWCRNNNGRYTVRYNTSFYGNFVTGFVAKMFFKKRLKAALSIDSFSGTGFSAESSHEKACAVVLLILLKSQYPSEFTSLEGFSWRV